MAPGRCARRRGGRSLIAGCRNLNRIVLSEPPFYHHLGGSEYLSHLGGENEVT